MPSRRVSAWAFSLPASGVFSNGCRYGAPTGHACSVSFPIESPAGMYQASVHAAGLLPSQLFESVGGLAIAAIVLRSAGRIIAFCLAVDPQFEFLFLRFSGADRARSPGTPHFHYLYNSLRMRGDSLQGTQAGHNLLLAYARNSESSMPRPRKLRRVLCSPQAISFKPGGILKRELETVSLTRDELEALRLADYEGLYQEHAAAKMKISRQTFGNIVASAHKKVADFLINSKRLSVEGGTVEIDRCRFICTTCRHTWSVSCGTERPKECPQCKSVDVCCSKNIGEGKHNQKCWRTL